MAKNTVPRGETSVIRHVFIMDSSSTTGAGKTGLAFDTASLTAYYLYPGGTAGALTLETITTLGTYAAPTSNAYIRFKKIDDTNMPGWYELQFHNDWFSVANARRAACVQLKGATGMAPLNLEIDCIGAAIQDALLPVNTTQLSGDATAADNAELFFDGTGYAGGTTKLQVDLLQILGTTLTEGGAGRLTAAFKKLFDVATPLLVASDVMRGTDSAALASVVGALADAASDGDPTTADTVMQYVKQLVNTLVGTAGIPAFPTEAAPGNGVSLSEVIRAIAADVTGLNGDAMRGTDSAGLATELAKVPKSDGTSSWNATALAALQSEANEALVANGLDHLVGASVAGTDIADNSIIAKLVSKSATADWDSYANTTDAMEALRDRGDAAWVTATGFATPTNITAASGVTLAADQAVNATKIGGTLQTAGDFLGVWTPTKAGYVDAAITSRHASGAAVAKSPATLATADVTGNLPANVLAWNTGALPTVGDATATELAKLVSVIEVIP